MRSHESHRFDRHLHVLHEKYQGMVQRISSNMKVSIFGIESLTWKIW